MSKRNALITLGVLIAFVPFFGIPLSWKKWVLALFGVAVAFLAYSLEKRLSFKLSVDGQKDISSMEM